MYFFFCARLGYYSLLSRLGFQWYVIKRRFRPCGGVNPPCSTASLTLVSKCCVLRANRDHSRIWGLKKQQLFWHVCARTARNPGKYRYIKKKKERAKAATSSRSGWLFFSNDLLHGTAALSVLHKVIENSAGGGAASARRHGMADWVIIQQIPQKPYTAATKLLWAPASSEAWQLKSLCRGKTV